MTYANVEATTLWDALSRKFPHILSISRSDTSKKKKTVKARTFHRQQHPVPRGTWVLSRGRERGQGGGEAKPSPNFCVHIVLFIEDNRHRG